MCTLSYYHHQFGSMTHFPLFMAGSWNYSMRYMSFYILTNGMTYIYQPYDWWIFHACQLQWHFATKSISRYSAFLGVSTSCSGIISDPLTLKLSWQEDGIGSWPEWVSTHGWEMSLTNQTGYIWPLSLRKVYNIKDKHVGKNTKSLSIH